MPMGVRSLIRLYCRHSPMDRGKYRLALWAFRHLDGKLANPTVCAVRLGNGLKVEINLAEFVQNQIYYIGFYEFYLARYFQSLMEPGSVFVDVGAHVGQYTLIAAAAQMETHAFEPDPENFAYLSRNLQLNHLNAQLNRCAVTDYTGEAILFPCGERMRNNSLRRINAATVPGRTERVTPVVHLDGYFAGHHDRIQLIKADVEGAELSVLKGAQQILSHSRPILIVEVADDLARAFDYTAVDLKRFLSELDYRFYAINRNRLQPVDAGSQTTYENLICLPSDSLLNPGS